MTLFSDSHCTTAVLPETGECYFYVPGSTIFESALETCFSMGGTMAILDSETAIDFVVDNMSM